MNNSKLERLIAELNLVKPVTVTLDGWEIYSLICAVQMLKLVDNGQRPKLVETAETAAQRILVFLGPLAREQITEGWKLIDEKLADSNKSNL
jgi:hypothetical protein